MMLRDLVVLSAQQRPDALAVKGPDGSLTYGELDNLSNRLARFLRSQGICRGDRVGIWMEKSTLTVVLMQGVLRLNAIYVPLDPLSPAPRICTILNDCQVRVLITTQTRMDTALMSENKFQHDIVSLCLDGVDSGLHWHDLMAFSPEPVVLEAALADDDEVAYILYTSGSTGKPKGVSISNRNALAFIEWAVQEIQAVPGDRFANHAPLHFDLSVFDLYVAFYRGAAVLLIPDDISSMPGGLVNYLRQEEPTIWYSVPSALTLMMEQGGMLGIDPLSLRTILFAGEPFSIRHLRRLHEHWPTICLLNLYGPTETNVCTFYRITEIQRDQNRPMPIGRACSGDQVWAQKEDETRALVGEEGELMVSGPTVMLGYWGQPSQGSKPYATGDLVRLQEDGNYIYIGRRDHMVKVRGYRVEPGDIEAALDEHPDVCESAVLVVGSGMDARLVAFLVCVNKTALSLLAIKRHCAQRLPRYMIVDRVRILSVLPHTRNGKIDRQALLDSEIQMQKTGAD